MQVLSLSLSLSLFNFSLQFLSFSFIYYILFFLNLFVSGFLLFSSVIYSYFKESKASHH